MPPCSSLYKRHRFPGQIISHAVWLYYRFLLSYRDVEELLAERGIAVSYETVRRWCRKFGQTFADGVRRRRPRPGDMWHIDEMQLKINGRKYWLWRAVDQDGVVLDILVQERRNQEAAEAFLRRVVDGHGYQPRVVTTDELASYPPAVRRVLPGAEHRRHKGWLFRELCGEGHKRASQANRDGETELLVRWALGAGRTRGDPDRPLLRAPANAVPPRPDLDGARRPAGRAARTGPLGSGPQVAGVTRPAGAGPAGGAGSPGHTLGA